MPATTSTSPPLPPALRRLVIQTFTKKYSLQLHASSLSFIAQTLAEHDLLDVSPAAGSSAEDVEAQTEAIEVLAKGCLDLGVLEEASTSGGSSMITAAHLKHVYSQLVAEGQGGPSSGAGVTGGNASHHSGAPAPTPADAFLTEDEAPPPQRWFDVIDAFQMPKVEWDPVSKTFVRHPQRPTALPPPLSKPLATRQRLQALRALVLRNENFCPPLPGALRSRGGAANTWMKLTSTSNLLGRPNGRFLLFGLLTTTADGRLALEDEEGRVELDTSEAIPGEGIFTLGSLVLVEGRYGDDGNGEGERLYVNAIGHPPSEARTRAREMYGHIDWSGKGAVSAKEEQALGQALQQHHPDLSFIVLSDLHLDLPTTLQSLRAVLQGYLDADFMPFLFVLCGDFLSEEGRRRADGGLERYSDAFSALADVLASFPSLFSSSYFLFVPGPCDPFATALLPRQPLPALVSDGFIARLASRLNLAQTRIRERAIFTSNPCRVRFWGKDIVIFRDEVMDRMRRNGVSIGEGKDVREGGMKKFVSAHRAPVHVT